MKNGFNVYLFGDIELVSEISLPELPMTGEPATDPRAGVNIHLGEIPPVLPGAIEVGPGCFAASSEYLLHIPGVASYRVSGGREILIQAAAGALEQDVRAYLLGSVFVVLCHQRGLLPLHASAVAYSGGVAAFLAGSGHGKSSLAAHLAGRGFQVIADDVCLVEARADGEAVVVPAAPWLKLWTDSLEHLGRPAAGLERAFSDEAKYRLPLEGAAAESALERRHISKLIFIESEEGSGSSGSVVQTEIKILAPLQTLPMLIGLTHQGHLLEAMGKREQNFLQCGRVASQASAYRLIRPWGLEYMKDTIDVIENLLRN